MYYKYVLILNKDDRSFVKTRNFFFQKGTSQVRLMVHGNDVPINNDKTPRRILNSYNQIIYGLLPVSKSNFQGSCIYIQ